MNRYEDILIKVYLQAETDIINELGRLREKGLIDYHAVAALDRVQKILKQLQSDCWEYVPKMVEREFYVNHPEKAQLLEPIEKHLIGYSNALGMTTTRREIVNSLVNSLMSEVVESCDNTMQNLGDYLLGRREDDIYRSEGMKYILRQKASGMALKEQTKDFINNLSQEGVTAFTDKAGRDWNLHTYGAMIVRTTNRQASVLNTITREPDRDLYSISSIGSTCAICAPLEGRVYSRSGTDPDFPPLAEAFGLIDPAGPKTLENTWLNIHPNCLVPGGFVLAESVMAHSFRDYDGEIIRLVTASGNEISVTPNHPILTPEGFVPAGSLHEGQEIIEATGEYGRFLGKAPDNIDIPTRIEEIPNALIHSCGGTTSRVKCSPEQFHGDGSVDGEVEIVYTDRLIRNKINPAGFKERLERQLPTTLLGRVLLLSESAFGKIAFCALCATDGIMRGLGLVRGVKLVTVDGEEFSNLGHGTRTSFCNLFERESLVMKFEHLLKQFSMGLKEFRRNISKLLARLRNNNAVVDTSGSDSSWRYAEMLRDLRVTEPLCAKGLDTALRDNVFVVGQLSHVERASYKGKVYNLQTEQGFYTYNSIVTHNCLHSIAPWTPVGKSPEEIERIKRFSSFKTNPRTNDPRTEEQIRAYREKERARAKFNRDYKQWERYRTTIPETTPKTFATFMRHKTLGDDKYKAWQKEYRAARSEDNVSVLREPDQ